MADTIVFEFLRNSVNNIRRAPTVDSFWVFPVISAEVFSVLVEPMKLRLMSAPAVYFGSGIN